MLDIVFQIFFEVFFFYSGEFFLWILTFGRRKIRWDYYSSESPTKFVLLTDLSVVIGVVIWLIIFGLIINRQWGAG